MKSLAIGIDLGGTHLRMALVSAEGEILAQQKIEVGNERGEKEVLQKIEKLKNELEQETDQKGTQIGLGVAGIVSSREGTVFASPHFPDWKDFRVGPLLSQQCGVPVFVDNDANMIARGEKGKGAGREWENFLMVTLGTGIGGALVIGSEVFCGDYGFAGEIGHMVIQAEGPPCACGSHGCFELYASATGLIRMIQEAAFDAEVPGSERLQEILSSPDIDQVARLAEEARGSNEAARGIFDRMGYYLGIGLASLVNVTGLGKIVLGGGISQSSDLFLLSTQEEFSRRTYKKTAELVEIRIAQLGDSAGLIGAGLVSFKKASSISE